MDWRQALETVGKWLSQSLSGVMGSMLNLLSSAVSTAFNLLVSFIFSIYLLMGKERLAVSAPGSCGPISRRDGTGVRCMC